MTKDEFIAIEAKKYEAQYGHDEALRFATRTLVEELRQADPRDKAIIEKLQCCPKCFSGEWLLKEANGVITCLNCQIEIIPIENATEILRQEMAQEQTILAIPSIPQLKQMKRDAKKAFAKAKLYYNRQNPGNSVTNVDEPTPGKRSQAIKWRTGWPAPGGLRLNEARWRGKGRRSDGSIIKLVKQKGGPGLNLGKRRRRIN